MRRKRNREKRVLLTVQEERDLNRILAKMSYELDCKIGISDLARAVLQLVRDSSGNLITEARTAGALCRPPNGDMPASLEFEADIAGMVRRALAHKRRRSIIKGKR